MNPLNSVRGAITTGFVVALVITFLIAPTGFMELGLARWFHILAGVMWIGLLWYFNVVQVPALGEAAADKGGPGGAGISKYVAPRALLWFRWAAMATMVLGILLAWMNGYLIEAYTLDVANGFTNPSFVMIGIGMWLGTIMWFNVWFVIWPNQQKALNIGGKYPDLAAADKAAAGKAAMIFSRINTLLSVPMLFSMVAAGHLY